MKFCEDHWTQLRKALENKGLSALVPDDGEQAFRSMVERDFVSGATTLDNFDPLMMAHNAILNRATELLESAYGWNPLLLFTEQDDRFVCPICGLNNAHIDHVKNCEQLDCDYPPEHDWTLELIDGATDYMVTTWKELND